MLPTVRRLFRSFSCFGGTVILCLSLYTILPTIIVYNFAHLRDKQLLPSATEDEHAITYTYATRIPSTACIQMSGQQDAATASAAAYVRDINALLEKSGNFTPTAPGVLIGRAYLLSDRLVRVIGIRQCNDHHDLYVPHPRLRLYVKLYGPNCPWSFNPHCMWMAFYYDLYLHPSMGIAQLTNAQDPGAGPAQPLLLMLTNHPTKPDNRSISISELIDVRKSTGTANRLVQATFAASVNTNVKRHHFLSVCVQPIFLFADWPQLVQFFELWRTQGATKFYVYWQSISSEVDQLLRVYETSSQRLNQSESAFGSNSIEIQRVAWPNLPIAGGIDVDRFVYRTEHIAAINDCALRARADSDWVAFVDIDEIIVPYTHQNISTMLHAFKPTFGALVVKSSNVRVHASSQKIDTENNERKRLDQVSFDHLHTVARETFVYDHGMRSKVIARPHALTRLHVHQVLQTSSRQYRVKLLSQKIALVYHLRRVETPLHPKRNDSVQDTHIRPMALLAQENWLQQLSLARKDHKLPIWLKDQGLNVIRELDACLFRVFQNKEICAAVSRCESNFTTFKPKNWIRPDPSVNPWQFLPY